MNYVDEDKGFEEWCENNYLPILSQAIWKKLFKRFNRSGWSEWVTVDNQTLMAEVQLRREATFTELRDKLIDAGLIEYIKGKKGSPNKYKLLSIVKKCTFTGVVQTEVQSVVQSVVQTEVQTVDINKLNETKLNETDKNIDVSYDTSPAGYRQRYTTEQLKIIDTFFEILKHTRKSAKLADSIILKTYKDWEKHNAQKVIFALHKYINNPALHDKKENYVLGIIRNASMADIEKYKKRIESEDSGISQQDKQFKTAYEKTLDSARSSIEKYKNGELKKIDI